MLNYGYMCYQAERPKTQAQQREADAQLGQLYAALAGLLRPLAAPVRALRRLAGDRQASWPDAGPGVRRHGRHDQTPGARRCQPAAPAVVTIQASTSASSRHLS
jgi:hypothetical protein